MSRRKSLGGTCTICERVNKNIGCSKKLLFWEIVIISKMETKPLCFIYLEIKITISLKSLKYICFLLLRAKKWYFYHYFLGVCESWLEWLFTKRKQKSKQKAEKNSLLEQQPMWSAGNTMYKDYYKIQKHSFEGELILYYSSSMI